jgi:hypothetical protein
MEAIDCVISAYRVWKGLMRRGMDDQHAKEQAFKQAIGMAFSNGISLEELSKAAEDTADVCKLMAGRIKE